MFEQVVNAFFEHGLPGVACVVLGFVVWKLYGELRASEAEKAQMVVEFQEALKQVQEARVADANKTTDRILELARSVDKSTEAMRDAIDAFHDRGR